MHPTTLQAVDPLTRYQELFRGLDAAGGWFTDSAWLRYAAQAAAMRPANAGDTARAISEMAEQLRLHARWYEIMATPFHLVVAATLVQQGDTVEGFEAYFAATRELLRQEGVHARGRHELVTILAMRVLGEGGRPSPELISRMKRIHACMKRHHWWLTGAEDLPACVLLATRPGPAEAVEGEAEAIYRALTGSGFTSSNLLQAAVNTLPLSGLPAAQAAERFSALVEEFRANSRPTYPEHFPALALLSLLDQDIPRIVERFLATFRELERMGADLVGQVNFNIACDLVFLDLVRFDRQLRPLEGDEALERMRLRIRQQRATSLLLVAVPLPPIEPIGV